MRRLPSQSWSLSSQVQGEWIDVVEEVSVQAELDVFFALDVGLLLAVAVAPALVGPAPALPVLRQALRQALRRCSGEPQGERRSLASVVLLLLTFCDRA